MSVVPSSSSLVIKALKEPARDRKKVKHGERGGVTGGREVGEQRSDCTFTLELCQYPGFVDTLRCLDRVRYSILSLQVWLKAKTNYSPCLEGLIDALKINHLVVVVG